jgi:BirA family biotin operon repressor/biotin-[acetyl-CoA-carboxylase] ligase
MDVAREFAEGGAPEGLVVVADEQTAGRGRSTHAWYSPSRQSLYASLLLRPPLTPAQTGWVTMIAALAVAEEIRDLRLEIEEKHRAISTLRVQSPISIKWFNDIHLGGRKVCGILVESSITGDQLDYAVLGIGLNVNTRFEDAPADVCARATSLREAWGLHETLDHTDILRRLLGHFEARYAHLVTARTSPAREYAGVLETLGREVRIHSGDEIIHGLAVRIEEDGALIVKTTTCDRRVRFGEML